MDLTARGLRRLGRMRDDEPFTDGPHLGALLALAERLGAGVIVR